MGLKNEWIHFGKNNGCRAYLSQVSSSQKGPALLVIQEAWGVDAHIQDVAHRFASAGYTVLAPDLYFIAGKREEALEETRIGDAKSFMDSLPPGTWFDPGKREASLAQLPELRRKQISQTMDTIFGGISAHRENHLQILLEAASALRQRQASQIGSVGFCMGGALSALLACRDPHLGAAVIFYGQEAPPEEISKISCKLLGFYGQTDKRLVDALPGFIQNMKEAGKAFEPHVYPGAGHAFFNDTRPSYDAHASRDAFARSVAFFNESLA